MKRSVACFIVLWLGAGSWCWAGEASHRQAVEELFTQIDMALSVNQTVEQLSTVLMEAVPEEAGYRDVVDAYVRKYLGWEVLKDEVADLYQQAFTEPELRELITFYNTAAGRKLLAQSPLIGQAISASVHRRLVAHSPELKQMMMDADYQAMWRAVDQEVNPPAAAPAP